MYLIEKPTKAGLFFFFFLVILVANGQYYHGFYEHSNISLYQQDRCFSATMTDINSSEYIMVGPATQDGQVDALAIDLVRSDPTGSMLVGKTILLYDPGYPYPMAATPTRIIRTANSSYEEYAITGYVIDPNGNFDVLFMLVDGGDGSVTLARRYDFTAPGSAVLNDYGYSISENLWGDFIIVGKSGNDNNGYDMAVLEIYGNTGLGVTGSVRTSSTYDFSTSPIFSTAFPMITSTDEIANDVVQDNGPTGSGNWNLFHVVGEIRHSNGSMNPFIITMNQHNTLPTAPAIAHGEIRSGYANHSFMRIKKTLNPLPNSFVILGYLDVGNTHCFIENISYYPSGWGSATNNYPTNWANIFDHGLIYECEVPFDIVERVYPGEGPYEGQDISEYFITATGYNWPNITTTIDYMDAFMLVQKMILYKVDLNGSLINKTVYEELGWASGRSVLLDESSSFPAVIVMGSGNHGQTTGKTTSMLAVRAYYSGVSGVPGTSVCEYDQPYYNNMAHSDNDEVLYTTQTGAAIAHDVYDDYEYLNEYVPCNEIWEDVEQDYFRSNINPVGNKKQLGNKQTPVIYPTYLDAKNNAIKIANAEFSLGPDQVKCYNLMGQLIPFSAKTQNDLLILEFSNLTPGNYFLIINTGTMFSTHKFVKLAE